MFKLNVCIIRIVVWRYTFQILFSLHADYISRLEEREMGENPRDYGQRGSASFLGENKIAIA